MGVNIFVRQQNNFTDNTFYDFYDIFKLKYYKYLFEILRSKHTDNVLDTLNYKNVQHRFEVEIPCNNI